MNLRSVMLVVCCCGLVVGFGSCSSDEGSGERGGEHGGREGRGEHGGREGRGEHGGREGRGEHGGREGRGEHGGREGGHEGEADEESGTQYALDATYDEGRKGARLILAYDGATNSFIGSVENTTARTLKRVRVEVHLSNGKELGPTPAADLAAGEKRKVTLQATSKDFDRWTAHPETGSNEHGHGAGGEHKKGR